jgi:hypothetical protein
LGDDAVAILLEAVLLRCAYDFLFAGASVPLSMPWLGGDAVATSFGAALLRCAYDFLFAGASVPFSACETTATGSEVACDEALLAAYDFLAFIAFTSKVSDWAGAT